MYIWALPVVYKLYILEATNSKPGYFLVTCLFHPCVSLSLSHLFLTFAMQGCNMTCISSAQGVVVEQPKDTLEGSQIVM